MVGPFMQGILLMGIIYWYSKGLINMINDYYRGEFNHKLKSELNEKNLGQLKQQKYDLSDMDQLVNIEMNREQFSNDDMKESVFAANDGNYLDLGSPENRNNCYYFNTKKQFLNILFTIIHNYYKTHPIKNPICWLNELNSATYNYTNTNYNFNLIKGK